MRDLAVHIEINGQKKHVGNIRGNSSRDAVFQYVADYMEKTDNRPISISLPFQKETFSTEQTANFFEGLLPEGFTRQCVAQWMHIDEQDYLSILAGLGKECLGAIQIYEEGQGNLDCAYKELTAGQVKKLAQEGATQSAELVTKSHLSLTGASGKVGLYYDKTHEKWYQPIGEAPSTHIVKQSHIRLKKIVANEQLCLLTAKILGISISDSFIIKTNSDNKEDVLFATQRYDRKISESGKQIDGLPVPLRLHQEDFAQALGISSAEKYEKNNDSYIRKMATILRNYAMNPMEDLQKLWDICVFNYLIGNTDNHIKNLSLLYGEDMKTICLAPAYDLVSTMVYESSSENMALSIGGLYNIHEINEISFMEEASKMGIGKRIANDRMNRMIMNFEPAIKEACGILTEQGFDEVEKMEQKILHKGGICKFL